MTGNFLLEVRVAETTNHFGDRPCRFQSSVASLKQMTWRRKEKTRQDCLTWEKRWLLQMNRWQINSFWNKHKSQSANFLWPVKSSPVSRLCVFFHSVRWLKMPGQVFYGLEVSEMDSAWENCFIDPWSQTFWTWSFSKNELWFLKCIVHPFKNDSVEPVQRWIVYDGLKRLYIYSARLDHLHFQSSCLKQIARNSHAKIFSINVVNSI